MNLRLALASVAVVAVTIVACSSSSTPAPDYSGSCAILASQCHGVKTPLGDECHDLGHDGDDAKCGPRKTECLAACPTDHDGGHPADDTDAGEDAGPVEKDAAPDAPADPCPAYCTCMKDTCASEPGYPFADEAACLAACAGFAAKDQTCFAQHCEDAKTAADKEHDCEHASGAVACH